MGKQWGYRPWMVVSNEAMGRCGPSCLCVSVDLPMRVGECATEGLDFGLEVGSPP